MTLTIHDDLLDVKVICDPYTYYENLRKSDPVHWNELWRGWILTDYDDVSAAFHDKRLSSNRMKPSKSMPKSKSEELKSTFEILSKWMVFNDPPQHTRLRMLVNKAFTPKAVEKLRPRIDEICNDLLNKLEGNEKIDLIKDYAYALPILVISEMLGLPEEDRDQIKNWSDDLLLMVFGAVDIKDRHTRAQNSLREMSTYLREVAEDRSKNPKDDLISAIAMAGDGDDLLTVDEIISTCTLLVFGGHETTTNLIANGMLALLQNPAEFEKLKVDSSLIRTGVEEFLRYDGPSKSMIRVAKEDVLIGSKMIKEGERLLLVQAGANRDPSKFENPNLLDISRNPNPHLGFGKGMHYCLGAPLARLEGEIAILKLIERFPNIELTNEKLEWQPTIINRGLKALPLQL